MLTNTKKWKTFGVSVVAWVLILQLAVPAGILAAANGGGDPDYTSRVESFRSHLAAQLSDDPLWDAFIKAPAIPHPEYDRNNSAIDQDPFFLRSQGWVERTEGLAADEPSFAKEKNSLVLNLPHQRRALVLRAPLTPIHFTDDFVFLTLDRESDLFQKVISDMEGEVSSEGVFFIDYRELIAKSASDKPVMIHFFPLPGGEWRGPLETLELPSLEGIQITSSEGVSLPIAFSDLARVQEVQTLNVSMGSALALQSNPEALKASFQGGGAPPTLLPARGSTMAFGMFFTGIDLDHPKSSLWETKSVTLNSQVFERISSLFSKLVPSAHADPSLYQGLIDKLIFFGWLFGTATTLSVVMKYTVLKKRLAKIQRITEARERRYAEWYEREKAAGTLPAKAAKPKGVEGLKWKYTQPIKDVASVFGTVMVRLGQVSSVLGANALEIFFDATMPKIAASDQSGVRKFLNETFNWGRKVSTGFTVNWLTLWLGAIIFGLGDTTQMAVQLFWFWPFVLGLASAHAGPFLHQRIDSVFNINNPNYTALAWESIGANMLSHLMKGPGGYQAETKAQQEAVVRKDVEDEMRAQGIDPILNIQERDKRIENRLDKKLQQMGIPGSNEFIGDLNSDWKTGLKWMGFSGEDARKGLRRNAAFVGETRPALVGSVLRQAAQEARRRAAAQPLVYGEAARILEDTARDLSLWQNLRNPIEGFKLAKKVRQRLTLLTYVGPINEMVKYVPQEWRDGYSPQSAELASQLYRQVMHSDLQKDPTAIMTASELLAAMPGQESSSVANDCWRGAVAEITRRHGGARILRSDEVSSDSILPQFRTEFETVFEVLVRNRFDRFVAAEKAEAYAPAKQSWMEARQQKTAFRKALELFTAERADQLPIEKQQDRFNELYARALGETVGMREVKVDQTTENFFIFVDREARKTTQEQETSDAGIASYLKRVSEDEARLFRAQLYAANWLRIYKEGAVTQELIPAIAVAQPGALQWLRKTDFVQASPALTRFCRFLESFCAVEQSHRLGLLAAIDRTLPTFYEVRTSILRNMKTFPSSATFGWAFGYYCLQVKVAWPLYTFLLLRSFLIYAPNQWLNRLSRMQGFKPMGGTLQKLIYSIPYSWVTMFGQPFMLFMNDVTTGFEKHVEVPIGNAVIDAEKAAVPICRQILDGRK